MQSEVQSLPTETFFRSICINSHKNSITITITSDTYNFTNSIFKEVRSNLTIMKQRYNFNFISKVFFLIHRKHFSLWFFKNMSCEKWKIMSAKCNLKRTSQYYQRCNNTTNWNIFPISTEIIYYFVIVSFYYNFVNSELLCNQYILLKLIYQEFRFCIIGIHLHNSQKKNSKERIFQIWNEAVYEFLFRILRMKTFMLTWVSTESLENFKIWDFVISITYVYTLVNILKTCISWMKTQI